LLGSIFFLAGCPIDSGPTDDLVLYLNVDGSLSDTDGADNALSDEDLARRITRALQDDGRSGSIELTIIPHSRAAHGDWEKCLRKCSDHGIQVFALKPDGIDLTHRFVLPRVGSESVHDPNQLPPMNLRLTADESGHLAGIRFNQKEMRDFHELQGHIITILGDDRGPNSIQASAEVALDCDANLQMGYVLAALDAITGFPAESGRRYKLIEKFRPIRWGDEAEVMDVFEEEEFAPIDTRDIPAVSEPLAPT
jgi:hypothetical protein